VPMPAAEGMDEDTARCLLALEEKLRLKRIQEVTAACCCFQLVRCLDASDNLNLDLRSKHP
jgi:hypothetical protein